ncbi:MAG: hypothetical protein PUE85_07015, partial [Firmicutes bacterium]|nr:hypothetical protein [Bacillota bacterium]
RQFCDIGLWAREYCDQIDWKLLYDQCASVHAENFAKAAFAIARRYLGVSFELPLPWDDGIDAEPLLHDALCSGIYGTNDYTRLHSSTMTLNAARAGRSGKKGGVLPSVFPSRAYMEKKYPYVRKHPALLPAAWIQRIVRYALSKEKHDSFGSVRLGRERIELLKLYGIIDFDSNS